MIKQWNELKASITELRDSGGTGTQQEICGYLVSLMVVLEKQMQEPCKDCISRQQAIEVFADVHPLDYNAQSYLAKIKALPPAQPEQEWISVSERLPDDDRTKVVTLANGNVEAGYYSNGDWWCVGDTIALENSTVIAWMPLPEAYKG